MLLLLTIISYFCPGEALLKPVTSVPFAVPIFSAGSNVGTVTAHSIDEASGLGASRIHSDVLYTHNDKGDRSRIFAIDANSGHKLADLEIANAANYDWEDIAVGVCPGTRNGSCIYIGMDIFPRGDIGDHGGSGSHKIIYVVEEPKVIADSTLYPIADLHYTWNVLDTETLMIDPKGNVILISKVHGGLGKIAMINYSSFSSSAKVHVTHDVTINIEPTDHNDPVGGDISPDGTEVLVRTHSDMYYWKVTDGNYLGALSGTRGHKVSVRHEHHGEDVAWDAQGRNYFTLSEGKDEPLYKYTRN